MSPSHAIFLFYYEHPELALKLLKKNVLIKDCGTKKAFEGGNFIRIAIRDRHDNQKFVEILKEL